MNERRRLPNRPDKPDGRPWPKACRDPQPEERKALARLRFWTILNSFPAMKNISSRLNMLTSGFVVCYTIKINSDGPGTTFTPMDDMASYARVLG